ncbi:MAG: metal-dependent hydrolase [Bryobacterales bacterium]|nr:metal-dependent hydrolase [Bryobacteraceae bacterium]MDW8130510.1 metal-dependent hydrolase [Bryobacterales bacterium]
MDPVTHLLSGIVLNRAGLERLCPQARWIVPLAAMAPDIDVVADFWGDENYLAWHRQWTHSLTALPAVAALPVLAVGLWARGRMPWRRGFLAALPAVALHDALDLTNSYGVRLLLPFSSAWIAWDLLFIVDLWIWAVFLLAILGPMLGRLVSREIGARGGRGRTAAAMALAFLPLYAGGRYLLHERAVAVLEARMYQNEVPRRVAALPSPLNPLRWRGLVETENFYATAELDLREEFDPGAARILHKAAGDPRFAVAEQAARRSRAFQVFLDFSRYPLWRFIPEDEPEGALRVEAMDLRFGEPPASRFVATAVVSAEGSLLRSWFRFQPDQPDGPRSDRE